MYLSTELQNRIIPWQPEVTALLTSQQIEKYGEAIRELTRLAFRDMEIDAYVILDAFLDVDYELENEAARSFVTTLEQSKIKVTNAAIFDTVKPKHVDDTDNPYKDMSDEEIVDYYERHVSSYIGDSFKLYMRDAGRYQLLTSDEELAAAKEAERGNREAYEKLVLSNLRLVINIAKRYQGQGLDLMDLIQEGNLGLLKAAERYDYYKGYRFTTYSTWWIRQAITRALADKSRTVRLPVHLVETINKLKRAIVQFELDYGRVPSTKQLAHSLGIEENRVLELYYYLHSFDSSPSLDVFVGDDEDSTLKEFIPSEDMEVLEMVIFKHLQSDLERILDTLTEREEQIIRLRFGFDGHVRTLEQVGRMFGVTRERIRQIEAKALRKLQHPSRSKRIKNYTIRD
jgi:RNA polymerase primary sigma factor